MSYLGMRYFGMSYFGMSYGMHYGIDDCMGYDMTRGCCSHLTIIQQLSIALSWMGLTYKLTKLKVRACLHCGLCLNAHVHVHGTAHAWQGIPQLWKEEQALQV